MNTNNLENSIYIEMSSIENTIPVNDQQLTDIHDSIIEIKVPVENPIIEIKDPVNDLQLTDIENPIIIDNQILISILVDIPVLEEISLKNIKKYSIDQDTLQRINVGIQFLLEMYRVIASSLLILFVPQICNDHICSTTENLVWESSTYNIALCFNFISMTSLVIMYYLELVRENRLIKYMSVNTNFANDDVDVAKRLELLPNDKKNKIFVINKYYKLSSYSALTIYSLNVILSAAAVNEYYAGSQTTSTFITYVLFIATKFTSVYSLVSTAKNIFYSAYMKSNVQFNDVDDDFMKV